MKALIAAFALFIVSLMIGSGIGALLPVPPGMAAESAHLAYALAVGGGTFAGFISSIYYEYE